ncbi:hypothetical protein UY3_13779 [Chelonia mydas]|uniref:Uncharacterized protein n=1 Tax=Chelonia mydas TaxID=8469 RepID=M7B117_CHEMY|nr:hypothetical protein UY3_13779 [Chelonia mydas]
MDPAARAQSPEALGSPEGALGCPVDNQALQPQVVQLTSDSQGLQEQGLCTQPFMVQFPLQIPFSPQCRLFSPPSSLTTFGQNPGPPPQLELPSPCLSPPPGQQSVLRKQGHSSSNRGWGTSKKNGKNILHGTDSAAGAKTQEVM